MIVRLLLEEGAELASIHRVAAFGEAALVGEILGRSTPGTPPVGRPCTGLRTGASSTWRRCCFARAPQSIRRTGGLQLPCTQRRPPAMSRWPGFSANLRHMSTRRRRARRGRRVGGGRG